MYFYDPATAGPNLRMLFSMILGFEACLRLKNLPSELEPFRTWLRARHAALVADSAWFGEEVLRVAEGDHERAFEEIAKLIDEYRLAS